MQPDATVLPLTPLRVLHERMEICHRSRRPGIFTGPPGMCKTTAIRAFAARYPANVQVITLNRKRTGARDVLRLVLQAVRRLRDWDTDGHIYQETHMIAGQLRHELKQWTYDFGRSDEPERLTIIFDEAQYLSREALDELRYWNDQPDDSVPVQLGLIFVGNHELSLKVDDDGRTVISRAVGDRARFIETMDYSAFTEDDLAMFVRSRGVDDPAAVTAIVRSFSAPRSIRSLRRVADCIEDAELMAGGKAITAEIVKAVL